MRIEALIEDGRPLLVFPDEIQPDKTIQVYGREGHATASRAYLRRLRKPETPAEVLAAWREIQCYAAGQVIVHRKN